MAAKRKKTDMIVIHCSATPASRNIGAAEINMWHKDKGWSGCGYHIVIRRDGFAESHVDGYPARPIKDIGAHAEGFNSHSIGICLVGGVNAGGAPEANFTDAQYNTLQALIESFKAIYPSISKVVGHRDLPGVHKACPSFDVAEWMASLSIKGAGKKLYTHTVVPSDTLYSIARAHNCTVDELIHLNPGVVGKYLAVGQIIYVPHGA